ncbi:hypothetical protein SJI19_16935 [Acerihabitans sp. TG2]|uniref:hypothetical protein n=1 Tax=Acerihabitans sp. TG2 TaxID=3096008 RepID=UPI002B22D801|nr:hypothetical protein [Acerihabitans sp. TG2]MEA9392212.1 hypothetical protein [Acerihabitans sp. TG2]
MKKPSSILKNALRITLGVPLGGALGINQLANNNEVIKNLWKSIKNPKCPACESGVLFTENSHDGLLVNRSEHKNVLVKYYCVKCGYRISSTPSEINEIVYQYRVENNLNFIQNQKNTKHIDHNIRSFKYTSRILYYAATAAFFYSIYIIASGGNLILAIDCVAISLPFFVSGMIRSYRCHQLQSNTLYVKGSFLRWLKYGKWFV